MRRLSLQFAAPAFAALLFISAPAAAQTTWGVIMGGGAMWSTHSSALVDAGTAVNLSRRSLLTSMSVVRKTACCVEFYGTWLLPSIGVTLTDGATTVNAAHISPVGFQVGANFRVYPKSRPNGIDKYWFYVTPFLSTFGDDRSASVQFTEGTQTRSAIFRFRSTLGGGGGLGWRYMDPDWHVGFDANVKLSHMSVFVGNDSRLDLNPTTLAFGLVWRP
ncbi:MAG TPA: hypothetical protein VK636_15420 [Gemmatimonadaceae bacterium]|nr:hypothetical protein [Gemmatimonadaceae bacterium]